MNPHDLRDLLGAAVRNLSRVLGRPKGLSDEDTLILDTATFLHFVVHRSHAEFVRCLSVADAGLRRRITRGAPKPFAERVEGL
jgi:hypothetical protein